LIARCYLAKQYGIKRGTSVQEAQRLCPQIALPIARHDEYVRLHQKILALINRHVPVRKVWSIDEMECCLKANERAQAIQIAKAIKRDLAEAFGPDLTCSIGLAPNQFLAKVAAEMDKPNGLVVLHPEDLPGRLLDLDLTDLPGVSANMERRLNAAGILTVAQLWQMPPKQARAIWRSVEGERLWAQLRGFAVTRPETERRMFGHGRVLSGEWRKPAKARDCLRLLTAKAARRLRREGYTASALSVSLASRDNRRWQRETRFFPARDDHTFLHEACTLFAVGVKALNHGPLKKLSVMLHGIDLEGQTSEDLFEQGLARTERRRWEALTEVMDQLNARHGACLVSLGPRHEPPGGYAGAKIAFGRVPDLNDFALTPEAARAQAAEVAAIMGGKDFETTA
ncbi:MAG: type VI secretion protein ImpB, partial [Pseudomonadota bacterium]